MKTFSNIINEAQEIKLSDNFKITCSDWHKPIAEAFLKKLDERATELGVTEEKAATAMRYFRVGAFCDALITIYGEKKVHCDSSFSNGNTKQTIIHSIDNYGVFTEEIESGFNRYSRNITLKLDDNRQVISSDLENVLSVSCIRTGVGDFELLKHQTIDNVLRSYSDLRILNCLFVGFADKDLSFTLNGCIMKAENLGERLPE